MSDRQLAPNQIAKDLFLVDPDRDERASQVCIETLLTLIANSYRVPETELRSPKLRRFALRSLVLGENFLDTYNDGTVGDSSMTPHEYGAKLMLAEDFNSADNLSLARTALGNLIDPSTQQGQRGQHLLLPFHDSLLWYDARRAGGSYTVRKVRMRGSGITLARMLLSPPPSVGPEVAAQAAGAVSAIEEALSQPSPLAEIAQALEDVLPPTPEKALEDDERDAWDLGGSDELSGLAERLCRHACGVMTQGGASGPERLWQLRSVFALDLALHTLGRAWERVAADPTKRAVLVAWPGADRQQDRVRLRSERSYNDCRTTIRWATINTLAQRMEDLAKNPEVSWHEQFESRSGLEQLVVEPLQRDGSAADFRQLAQLAFEGANYDRAGDGFRVLLESIGMLAGGTRYRYASCTPDLLAAMVGALSAEMPMPSAQLFRRIRQEWGFVISPESAVDTEFYGDLDGAELAVNAQRCERLLVGTGLASALSDRTVLVGERAGSVTG
jgi:hypothetical protein